MRFFPQETLNILSHLIWGLVIVYLIFLGWNCWKEPKRIRLAGVWVGSKLVALGWGIEDGKDSYRMKSKRIEKVWQGDC